MKWVEFNLNVITINQTDTFESVKGIFDSG
jgi:hypothetical protein